MGILSLLFHFRPGPLSSYPAWLDLLSAVPDEYWLTGRRGPLGLSLGRRQACVIKPACPNKPDQEMQMSPDTCVRCYLTDGCFYQALTASFEPTFMRRSATLSL